MDTYEEINEQVARMYEMLDKGDVTTAASMPVQIQHLCRRAIDEAEKKRRRPLQVPMDDIDHANAMDTGMFEDAQDAPVGWRQ